MVFLATLREISHGYIYQGVVNSFKMNENKAAIRALISRNISTVNLVAYHGPVKVAPHRGNAFQIYIDLRNRS